MSMRMRERCGFMKTVLPEIVDRNSDILLAKAEQALLDRLPMNQKTMQRLGKLLEPKNLKRIAIGAVCGTALISVVTSLGHDRMYQAAVGREMKKQLEPLRKKLDELEAQNVALWQQNEELKAQLQKMESHG